MEVEEVLFNISGVNDAAVIGVPDEIVSRAVMAVVVPIQGAQLDERDVRKACQSKLESFIIPKLIVSVSRVPKSFIGMIQKAGLC